MTNTKDDKTGKTEMGLYYLPVPLVALIKNQPEAVLFLLVKLYQRIYPKVKTEKIYEAIWEYVHNIHFDHVEDYKIDESTLKPEEIN